MGRECCIKNCKSEFFAGCGISFHRLPLIEVMKQKWLEAIPHPLECIKGAVVCSAHFRPEDYYQGKTRLKLREDAVPSIFPKLPNDMENYIQYSVMGSVGKIRMKPDCLPSKLECQPDGMKPEVAVGATTNSELESATGNSFNFKDQATQVCPEATSQFVQVYLRAKIRSKAVQCTIPMKDKSTSVTNVMYSATSPFTCGVESATFENTKVKSKLLFSNGKLGESHIYSTLTSPSSQSLLVMRTNNNQETQCKSSEIQSNTETKDVYQMSTGHTVLNNSRYNSPDAEQDRSLPLKMEVQEDRPRVPQQHRACSNRTCAHQGARSRPRATRHPCVPIKVTSGPSPTFQINQPQELIPAFLITGIKSEADKGPPSREETISYDDEPAQIDENQPIEDLVPLSAHPVPLSNAPDPLCDFQIKREEEEKEVGDGTAVAVAWAVKEEDRTVRVKPVEVIVDSEPTRVVQPAVDNLSQSRKQEQKIKNLTRQREQLRVKVRNMRELIRRRDAKIKTMLAQLHALRGFVTQHHGHGVLDELAGGSCRDADTQQIQSVKTDERKKKPNRVVFVVKGADRPKTSAVRHKSAQSTSHTRPKSAVQGDADILQQSLIGVLDTSEILQKTLFADKNTSDTGKMTPAVPEKSVTVKKKLDIRKNPSLVIQPVTDIPKKPSADTKRSLIVVKAKSANPQIGSKRKSDIRHDASVVIHPKLDVAQKLASDIPQPTDVCGMSDFGLQRPSDVRQNALVIQIDGMHSTVLQPKLVRLDDNNMDLG